MNEWRLFPLLIVGIGAFIDIRTRRIPNVLTFGGAFAGLLYWAWASGWSGLGVSAAGWVVGVALFLPLFLLRGMGGGDVKLLGAVGAWLGPVAVLVSALYATIAGAALALVVGARHRYLGTAFRNLWALFGVWRTAGVRPGPGLTLEESAGPRLPYGLAIAIGTAAAIYLR